MTENQEDTKEFEKLRRHNDDLTKKYKMVTERHLRQADEVSLLQKVIHISADPHDFDRLCESYMDLAMESTEAESGAFYFYDGSSNELYFAAARGPKAKEVLDLDITLKPGVGMVGACFTTGEVIALSDVTRDARFSKEVSEAVGYEVRSILTTPIRHEGQTLGAIQIINKKRGDSFTPDEIDWFERLGRYAGYSFALFLELQMAAQTNTENSP